MPQTESSGLDRNQEQRNITQERDKNHSLSFSRGSITRLEPSSPLEEYLGKLVNKAYELQQQQETEKRQAINELAQKQPFYLKYIKEQKKDETTGLTADGLLSTIYALDRKQIECKYDSDPQNDYNDLVRHFKKKIPAVENIREELKASYEESKALDTYTHLKKRCISEKLDSNKIVELLTNNYSKAERKLMMRSHLLDVYREQGTDLQPSHQLQKAFAKMRGIDFRETIENIAPLSYEERKNRADKYDKRYETCLRHESDETLEVGTIIKGYNKLCYSIDIDEDNIINVAALYKRRPDKRYPETLGLPENDMPELFDNELKPFTTNSDGQKVEIPGAEPSNVSDIMRNQIQFLCKKGKLDMSFRPNGILGEDIRNTETIRTMSLFMKLGEVKSFKKGDDGYVEALATPVVRNKVWFLAENFPELEIAEIEVSRGEADSLPYIEYKLGKKGSFYNSNDFTKYEPEDA